MTSVVRPYTVGLDLASSKIDEGEPRGSGDLGRLALATLPPVSVERNQPVWAGGCRLWRARNSYKSRTRDDLRIKATLAGPAGPARSYSYIPSQVLCWMPLIDSS